MKILIVAVLGFCSFAAKASLVGEWHYIGFQYEGQIYPALDPNLDLRFKFNEDHTVTLSWHYENTDERCERRAIYESQENQLYQKVVWVNPDNYHSCASDPDMQAGRESLTPFEIKDERLFFNLEMGGKPLLYFLERMNQK